MDVFEEVEKERADTMLRAAGGPVKRAQYQTLQGLLSGATAYYRAALETRGAELEVQLLGEMGTAVRLIQERIEARRDDLLACLDWQEEANAKRLAKAAEREHALETQARGFRDFAELG